MPANSDEALVVKKNNENIIGIGNFHKSLPHNQFGEVVPSAYRKFALTASTVTGNFEDVDRGQHSDPTFPPADLLVSPLAGKAKEFLRTRSPRLGDASCSWGSICFHRSRNDRALLDGFTSGSIF